MTLDQLRIFVAVAERQHVTHAADALNLAQSAASHAIASLEERHQTKLFNRIGRHIELTDAGQAFLKEARAVLATVEAAELAVLEFSNLKRGVLSVQASQTIANYWLPRHLAAFRSAYPQIEIRAYRLDVNSFRKRACRPLFQFLAASVFSFKQPSREDLDHDFMWRYDAE